MRKLGLKHSLTAQCFVAGMDWPTAQAQGASLHAWELLVEKYGKGELISAADWNGHSEISDAKAVAHTASHYNY